MDEATLIRRLSSKIVFDDTGCWLWTAGTDGRGYGAFWNGKYMEKAHRVVYRWIVGPIPDGLTLDHLCRVTICVNPQHLEPVSVAENSRRGLGQAHAQRIKTHCPSGHSYADHAYSPPCRPTARYCKLCNNAKGRARRAAARAAL